MVTMRRSRTQQAKSRASVTCKRVASLIADYLAGDLDAATTFAFERHLLECPDCVSFLNTYKKTIQAARSLRYEDIPAEMKKRTRQFLLRKIKDLP